MTLLIGCDYDPATVQVVNMGGNIGEHRVLYKRDTTVTKKHSHHSVLKIPPFFTFLIIVRIDIIGTDFDHDSDSYYELYKKEI